MDHTRTLLARSIRTMGRQLKIIVYSSMPCSGFSGSYGRASINSVNQPFSITQVIKIHLEPNFQTMSFESDLNVVPKPEMLLVIVLGLVVLVFSVRLDKRRSLLS